MKIHVDFPLAAVEALKKAGVGSTDKPFNFVYVSGEGSDPSQKSMFMWARGKVRVSKEIPCCFVAYDGCCAQGRAETELAKALDTPTTRLLVARPGYFFPAHAGQRQNQHSGIQPIPRYRYRFLCHQYQHGNIGRRHWAVSSWRAKGFLPRR
jgi:hypothetical protein